MTCKRRRELLIAQHATSIWESRSYLMEGMINMYKLTAGMKNYYQTTAADVMKWCNLEIQKKKVCIA